MDQMDLNQATDQLWELFQNLTFEMTQEALSPEEDRAIKERFAAVCHVLEAAEDLRRFKSQINL